MPTVAWNEYKAVLAELSRDEDWEGIPTVMGTLDHHRLLIADMGQVLRSARRKSAALHAAACRYTAHQEIEWESPSPCRSAVEELVGICEGFDKITRFRLAASDIEIVASAAHALVDANEHDGPAGLYERVIETGMVFSYVRPFLQSNEAGIGQKWWASAARR